jgi:hypothetical protein
LRFIILLVLTPAAAAQAVDPSTLDGKVLAGYQGWFGCPGDGNEPQIGWNHWSHSRTDIGPGLYAVDMWPDVSGFDPEELFLAPNVQLADGSTGQLFSSRNAKTVTRHFKWMRDSGIDGVFLERFIGRLDEPVWLDFKDAVLHNVRVAAGTHGRVFAIEYDISNTPPEEVFSLITNDWKHLVDDLGITSDPRYLHHDGRPVVAVWGFGFVGRSEYSPSLAASVIDFFKNDPVYGNNTCVGGVPARWRTLTGDALTDPAWADVHRSWDVINPWTVGRYVDSSSYQGFRNNVTAGDIPECASLGIDYLPVVWPGSSHDNRDQEPPGSSLKPRNHGTFFWEQIHGTRSLGIDKAFVAMFDEVDEGTAIFKVSDYPPVTDHWVTYEGDPHDWYMRLAGAAGGMIRGEIPLSSAIPIDPHCSGDEVEINLGEDAADRMTHPQVSDGDTIVANAGAHTCRRNAVAGNDKYMYFAVDDSFAFEGSRPDVCVIVDFYDTGSGSLTLQYDSNTGTDLAAKYKSGGSVSLVNTETWKRKIFLVADAFFGNRQNNGADFRIARSGSSLFYLDRVLVGSPVAAPAGIQLNATSFNHTIETGQNVFPHSFTVTNSRGGPLSYTISADAGWLSVVPASGMSTGESDIIRVNYDTGLLAPGDYSAMIVVVDAEPSGAAQSAGVSLHVVRPPTPGDFDLDEDVDQEDFGHLQACLGGSGDLPLECRDADLNNDDYVNAEDFGVFEACMGGSNNPPGC